MPLVLACSSGLGSTPPFHRATSNVRMLLIFGILFYFDLDFHFWINVLVYPAIEVFEFVDLFIFCFWDNRHFTFRTVICRPYASPSAATLFNRLCISLLLSARKMVSRAYLILLKILPLSLITSFALHPAFESISRCLIFLLPTLLFHLLCLQLLLSESSKQFVRWHYHFCLVHC